MMSEEKKTVGFRVGKAVTGAKRIGLVVIGLAGYAGVLVMIATWGVWAVSTGRADLTYAVMMMTIANAVVHGFVIVASV